jgi:hypothetical protein
MALCLESGLRSVIRAAANCISCWEKLMTMGILHGPAYPGRLLMCLGALFVLAFAAVHAEVSPSVAVEPSVEVDADFDVMVAGAPGTPHVRSLVVLLFFSLLRFAENENWSAFIRNLVQRRFDYEIYQESEISTVKGSKGLKMEHRQKAIRRDIRSTFNILVVKQRMCMSFDICCEELSERSDVHRLAAQLFEVCTLSFYLIPTIEVPGNVNVSQILVKAL